METGQDSKIRTAVFLFMPPRGTYTKPLLKNLLDTCLSKYANVLIPDSEDFLSIKKQNLKPIKSFEELVKFPYIVNNNLLSLPQIREKGNQLIKTFKNFSNVDFFVVGDYDAMKFAALLSLWFLENKLKSKFIAIPCCPFNSVPFTEFSAGFGSALKLCKETADTFIKEKLNSSVGVMQIKGDKTGWLTAGTSALCNFPNQTLFISPETVLDTNNLLSETEKICLKDKTALIIIGEFLKTKSEKGIVHHIQKVWQLINKIIAKAGFKTFNFQISTDFLFDEAHISKYDKKICKSYGAAAVKFAKKSKGNIMIINRPGFNSRNSFSFDAIPLYDAVTTPRKLPNKFLTKNYRRSPALKKYLELIAK